MQPAEVLVEVAYTALTIAVNCATALAEKGQLTSENSELIVGQLKRLAALVEHLHDGAPDALPSIQAGRLQAVALQIEGLSRSRPTPDG